MIDVIIYADEEDMPTQDLCAGEYKSSTKIREALQLLGFKNIGLVSIRNKSYFRYEYNDMVVDR